MKPNQKYLNEDCKDFVFCEPKREKGVYNFLMDEKIWCDKNKKNTTYKKAKKFSTFDEAFEFGKKNRRMKFNHIVYCEKKTGRFGSILCAF